jgi:hypothetical protein
MQTMVDRIKSISARPVILSASPVNNGEMMAKLQGNQRLHEYAVALKEFSQKNQLPYADQFHRLIDVWGENKPRENLANSIAGMQKVATDDKVAGVEHLRAFLAVQDKLPQKPLSMQGDPVHPGAPGQLMMAAALLKELGAEGQVSSVSLDAVSGKADAQSCKVENVKVEDGRVEFDRTDERLPFPIPDECRPIVAFDPTVLELSQYLLKVTGLKGARYVLKVNGAVAGTLSAEELAAGVNLTALGPAPQAKEVSPIVAQGRAILAAVNAKEGVVGQFRGLSQRAHAAGAAPELKTELAALLTKVEEADAKIREAARPQKLRFELSPQ